MLLISFPAHHANPPPPQRAESLYLTLVVTNERLIRQIAFRGLTVWLDAGGGARGVMPEGWTRPGKRRERREPGAPRKLPTPRVDQLALRYDLDEPGDRYPADGVPGVLVAASMEVGTLVYELRVPLRAEGDAFALGVAPGAEIGVGLETPEFDFERGRRPTAGGGDRPGGGVGTPGGSGMPGGRGRAGDRRSSFSTPEPLSEWVRVTLAEE